MRRYVLLFPGQGSQMVGMAKDLVEIFPNAKHVLEEVDSSLKYHLSKIMFTGSDNDLRLTKNAQPAILAHSIATLHKC